ncbi:hypothetical protein CYMTET_21411 [Cymbomonas tetramitiformis]|uniref:Uncharacterized protein n=1 Tax=Cymbomonas tetramitiformis TaxID=36881 RepID=A0AAE0G2F2_9CHLO|nr:hypothetical protein CYMTET_21411 [Cymbomonas tetramitiformis]
MELLSRNFSNKRKRVSFASGSGDGDPDQDLLALNPQQRQELATLGSAFCKVNDERLAKALRRELAPEDIAKPPGAKAQPATDAVMQTGPLFGVSLLVSPPQRRQPLEEGRIGGGPWRGDGTPGKMKGPLRGKGHGGRGKAMGAGQGGGRGKGVGAEAKAVGAEATGVGAEAKRVGAEAKAMGAEAKGMGAEAKGVAFPMLVIALAGGASSPLIPELQVVEVETQAEGKTWCAGLVLDVLVPVKDMQGPPLKGARKPATRGCPSTEFSQDQLYSAPDYVREEHMMEKLDLESAYKSLGEASQVWLFQCFEFEWARGCVGYLDDFFMPAPTREEVEEHIMPLVEFVYDALH